MDILAVMECSLGGVVFKLKRPIRTGEDILNIYDNILMSLIRKEDSQLMKKKTNISSLPNWAN